VDVWWIIVLLGSSLRLNKSQRDNHPVNNIKLIDSTYCKLLTQQSEDLVTELLDMQMRNIVMETYRFGNVAWEKQWKMTVRGLNQCAQGFLEIFIGG
jgi:hypothetical protein